jgi:hypothetical protein
VRREQPELTRLGWTVQWLPGHGHMTANDPDVALPVVRSFFRAALRDQTRGDAR